MPYKMIDLFAGCGGLEDGFLQSGRYEDVAAVEWLQPQVKTLIHRLKTSGISQTLKTVSCALIFRKRMNCSMAGRTILFLRQESYYLMGRKADIKLDLMAKV